MVGVTVVGARRRRRVLAGGSGTVLALSDDHLLALVRVDILIAVVVALGPLSMLLGRVLVLGAVLAALAVGGRSPCWSSSSSGTQ